MLSVKEDNERENCTYIPDKKDFTCHFNQETQNLFPLNNEGNVHKTKVINKKSDAFKNKTIPA